MRVRLKHIKRVRKRLADGTIRTYHYHRLTGRRIDAEPGTPDFLVAYEAAAKHEGPPAGTFHALAAEFLASTEFARLAPRTRADFRAHLDRVLDRFGDAPLAALEDKRIRRDIIRWRDEVAATSPRTADHLTAVLRRVLAHGLDTGAIAVNHATRIARTYRPARAEKVWGAGDEARFLAAASPAITLAWILARDSGQRQGDLLRLTWSAWDGRVLRLTQAKTGTPVAVPATERLRDALAAAPRTAVTILTNSRGRPWTGSGFRASFRKTARRAGIVGLTCHDLRGTLATELALSGCTTAEIAAVTGHAMGGDHSVLSGYMSRSLELAERAIAKREERRKGNRAANQGDNRVAVLTRGPL